MEEECLQYTKHPTKRNLPTELAFLCEGIVRKQSKKKKELLTVGRPLATSLLLWLVQDP